MRRSRDEGALLSVICIVPFCVAMALRDVVNIWLGTSAAAAISIPLAVSEMQRRKVTWHRRPTSKEVLIGLIAGLLMAAATWIVYPVAVGVVPELATKVGWLYDMLRQPPGPQRALLFLLAVVVAEELVWRGIVMDWLLPRFGPLRAVILSSLLYVLPQVAFRSLTLIGVAFACGIVWSTMRVSTRSIWPPLVAHLVWDILVFIIHPIS